MPALVGCSYDAGELLDLMRFDTEGLLLECKALFGDKMPDCPSQSTRAHRALCLIAKRQQELRDQRRTEKWDEFMRLTRMRNRLEKFLSVHETVCILERRHRDPNGLDCFGFDLPRQPDQSE